MAYTHYNVHTYVHIPTGAVFPTCYELDNIALEANGYSILLFGYPLIEWECIKTENLPYNHELAIRGISNRFELRYNNV